MLQCLAAARGAAHEARLSSLRAANPIQPSRFCSCRIFFSPSRCPRCHRCHYGRLRLRSSRFSLGQRDAAGWRGPPRRQLCRRFAACVEQRRLGLFSYNQHCSHDLKKPPGPRRSEFPAVRLEPTPAPRKSRFPGGSTGPWGSPISSPSLSCMPPDAHLFAHRAAATRACPPGAVHVTLPSTNRPPSACVQPRTGTLCPQPCPRPPFHRAAPRFVPCGPLACPLHPLYAQRSGSFFSFAAPQAPSLPPIATPFLRGGSTTPQPSPYQ